MKKKNKLILQSQERKEVILQTIADIKKNNQKKAGKKEFILFCEKVISEYSLTFLKHTNTHELYDYYQEIYQNFINNLEKKFFISVSRKTNLKNEEYSNKLTAEIIIKDRPFVVSSIQNYFYVKQYFNIVQLSHSIIPVIKKVNKFVLADDNDPHAQNFSYTMIMLNCSYTTEESMKQIKQEITKIIVSLIYVTDDFKSMQSRLNTIKQKFPKKKDDTRSQERHQLYEWISSKNMTLLGLSSITKKELVEKNISWKNFNNNQGFFAFCDNSQDKKYLVEIKQILTSFQKSNLSVTFEESQYQSQLYSLDKLVYIFAKEQNKEENEVYFCLVCLFTQASKKIDIMTVPLANYKLKKIIKEDNIYQDSYSYKHIRDFFNKFPKYECFRMENDEIRLLLSNSRFIWEIDKIDNSVYYLKEKNYARLVISIPIEQFGEVEFSKIHKDVSDIIKEKIGICYWFKFRNVIQCHFVFFLPPRHKDFNSHNLDNLNFQIRDIFEDWNQVLSFELDKSCSSSEASKNKARYQAVFNKYYQSTHNRKQVIQDINNLNFVLEQKKECVNLDTESEGESTIILYTNKVYHLSNILPELQNLSLNVIQEISYEFVIEERKFHKYTYHVTHQKIDVKQKNIFKKNIEEALLAILNNILADESLNGLVTKSAFNFKQANLFTALKKYMYQLKCNIENHILDSIILSKPELNNSLIEYFETKFNPAEIPNRKEKIAKYHETILLQITGLKTLTEDNIFRSFFNFINAMIRTNYYSKKIDEALAFKIDCSLVQMMQNPKPMYEIFVYGIDMTGIHLRGSKIARGGLRFSDRKDDFRTEILGLVSAQMLKNAVIVPEGSKGGFVIDEPFNNRAEMFVVVEKHYRRFISALLSLTDNSVKAKIIPPENVVRYDQDDPYLVVAADKGTAHLSDVANEISNTKGFWLGDAFASGGSIGYNHKKVGITAKGAWECVKIHFLELGIDIQTENFSVVGIGDMGGDVFGNGMLLSKKIQLKGAFNHIHIFVDPKPPKDDSAWKERKRLFDTTGTSWLDYNKKLISTGGGIFERNSKSISLNKQIKEFLKTEKNKVSGEELIRMLLTAEIDLLWNGGIGTYVKSKNQTQLDVGDPSNDSVRVDASNLKAKVIGEGGNLGFTQASRIEYALNGGKINADSIDNSAGVNMSDNEVNIKIMINKLMENKKIPSEKERVKLLAELTDEVTVACLNNNRFQSYILSLSQIDSKNNLDNYLEFVNFLIDNNIIDPEKEELVTKEVILEKELGIPRPFLCSLLSYAKIYFYRILLPSSLADEKFCQQYFIKYFPAKLAKKFDLLKYQHQLYREIISSFIINKNINQFGIPFLYLLNQWSNRPFDKIMQAYMIADNIFEGDKIREIIFQLYSGKKLNLAYQELQKLENFLKEIALWLLLNHKAGEISFKLISEYQSTTKKIYSNLFLVNSLKETQLQELFEAQKSIANPLEIVYLVQQKKLSKEKAELLTQQMDQLFGFRIIKRLPNLKIASYYGKKHIGLLLQNINGFKQELYDLILKDYKKFEKDPNSFFSIKTDSLLHKINTQEGFLAKNSEELLHIAAVLNEEIKELLN